MDTAYYQYTSQKKVCASHPDRVNAFMNFKWHQFISLGTELYATEPFLSSIHDIIEANTFP